MMKVAGTIAIIVCIVFGCLWRIALGLLPASTAMLGIFCGTFGLVLACQQGAKWLRRRA